LDDPSTPAAGLDVPVEINETTKLPRVGLDQVREVVRSRERDRHTITLGMLGIIGAIVAGTGVAVGFGKLDAADALQVLFTPLLAVFTAIVGFYFGSHTRDGPN